MTEPLDVRLRQARPIPLDAAFGVAAGELLALVGPSGAGKTTCLRMIAGLDRPADGRISGRGGAWFDAAAGIDRPPQARAIGMVFQHYALFPHLGALDNVALALGHRPAEARAARARELLDLVNLAGLEARKPAQLSGGQQQRVALARALARDPAALLLDEPFAAVDQVTRRKLQRELAQLRRRLAMPIVLVTHDLDEAAALADRMAILSQGRTLQIGPPAEILARPKDAQVARLVGLTNLFSARVLGHEGDFTLLDWNGRRIEARRAEGFAAGAEVGFVVPRAGVILHRRDRPSRGERENPLPGRIVELVRLGDEAEIALAPEGAGDRPLRFAVSDHVARRNGLAPGVEAAVSLLADAVHVIPAEEGLR